MKSMFPSLLRAKDPISLYNEVCDAIQKGKDLHAPLFADGNGVLCQFVVPSLCLYEYRLIEALDVDDLETQVQSLANLGFDFMFNTVQWNGKLLQWMARMSEKGTEGQKLKGMEVLSVAEWPVGVVGVVSADKESKVRMAKIINVGNVEGANQFSIVKEAMPVMRGRFLVGDQ